MEPGWVQILLTVVSVAVVSGGTIAALRVQAKDIGRRLEQIEEEMKQMTAVRVQQATQAVRLDTMDVRLNSQGRRLDEAIKAHADSLQTMGRMVGDTISRVNNFMDSEFKRLLIERRAEE